MKRIFTNSQRLLSCWVILLFVTACGGGSNTPETPPTTTPPDDSGEVLQTSTYVNGSTSWTYQKLRLPNRTGGYAYAQYYQANGNGPHPVVVITKPYAGIDWTNEAVDARWANAYKTHLANGGGASMCVADVDGPDYNPQTSSTTCYTLSNDQQTGDEAFLYLLNNLSVLITYGRFYAGGHVANDIEDTVAGLRFLATRPEIDTTNIGVIGGSWGGFEALYASLKAPTNVKPAAVVPMYPITDFSLFVNFINSTLPGLVTAPVLKQYNQFYDPYLRRLYASIGKPPNADFTGYTLNDLTALVDMPVLLPHDDGDTILPAQFSHSFAANNSNLVEGFWYRRTDNAPWQTVITSHGSFTAIQLYTFTSAYLFEKLVNTNQGFIVPYIVVDMQNFFNDIRGYQLAGRDVNWLVPRLIELCDSRITMHDVTVASTVQPMAGAQFVAQYINAVWGTGFTATTVLPYLLNNGLPP